MSKGGKDAREDDKGEYLDKSTSATQFDDSEDEGGNNFFDVDVIKQNDANCEVDDFIGPAQHMPFDVAASSVSRVVNEGPIPSNYESDGLYTNDGLNSDGEVVVLDMCNTIQVR